MSLFKKRVIQFNGTKEISHKIKNQTDNVISRRYKILIVGVVGIAILLMVRLFITQINQQDYYTAKLSQYNTDIFQADTFRGSIYDRNYKRLVYNKNINCATYYAVKNIKEPEIDVIVNFLIKNITVDTSSVTDREKKDYLIKKDKNYVNSLLTSEELKYKSDVVYSLQLERITEDILKSKLTDNDIKYYKLFFTITNCTSGSAVLLEGLTIKEASLIGENSSLLRGIKVTNDWERAYTYDNDFKSVLGKVTTKKQGLPATDKEMLLAAGYNNDSRVGISGIEQQYESILSGTGSSYSITYDTAGNPTVNQISTGTKGQDIRITVDWDIQTTLGNSIESELKAHIGQYENYGNHIFVVLMDPNNGEIVAIAGKERDPKTGDIIDYAAGNYLSAYEIGSTFKGGTIYMAFKNNLIQKNTVFVDKPWYIKGTKVKQSWRKGGFGPINEIEALSVSSNVYMFNIATILGKGKYVPEQALVLESEAFDEVRRSVGELGLGVKTGIDVPTESLGYRGTSRQSGNLLDFVIGQYDTYTPIQMVQYVSTIANSGLRIQPHLFLDSFAQLEDNAKITQTQFKTKILDDVSEYTLAFERVQTGFRVGAETGLASSVNSYYRLAGKTGTADVYIGNTDISTPNRSFVGYAPYDDPQISVACMAERQYKGESCKGLSKTALTQYFDKYGVKSK